MVSVQQMLNMGKSYLSSQLGPLPLWTHLWITDKCDLKCEYCEVVDNERKNPSKEEIGRRIVHADYLGSSVIAFMGGEPTLRKDFPDLVRFASERNLFTYVTSHGQKNSLSSEKLAQLGEAGLTVLEVSLDGYDTVKGSDKTLHGDESLIERLEQAQREYGLRYKAHQVLAPANLDETAKLVELSERRKLPISFGLVTEFSAFNSERRTVYEEPMVKEKIKKTLRYLIERKKAGTKIINAERYFHDALRFIDEPLRWPCDVGTYMIQVATNGEIFKCSKYMKQTNGIKFLDIDKSYFKDGKHNSEELLDKCNDKCFSACAYNTSYFRRNPLMLLETMREMF
ncbi:radical SAM protein [Candidatus Woesearchaeota archaeon]|nr:radical SAM protein [Candidatus Woesearchaeota archaeon]